MTPFNIEIQGNAQDGVRQLVARLEHPEPAMRAIAMVLLSQTEANLGAESGPLGKWPDLAESTKKARANSGKWPGKKLQVSGHLAASITPFWSEREAGIGSNAIQAAIQQLGGVAGRGHLTIIPARPSMPVGPGGTLQAGVEDDVMDIVQSYLMGAG